MATFLLCPYLTKKEKEREKKKEKEKEEERKLSGFFLICLLFIFLASLGFLSHVYAISSPSDQRLLSSWCAGFSLWYLLFCRAWALGAQASGAVAHGLSCPSAVESSWARNQTCVPCIGRQILNHWAIKEVLVSSDKGTNTIMKSLPSRPHLNLFASQRPHLLLSLHWESGLHHMIFAKTQTFSPLHSESSTQPWLHVRVTWEPLRKYCHSDSSP